MGNSYYGTTPVNDWNPNGSPESGHDFIDRTNKQKEEIEKKGQQYDEYGNQVSSSRDAYNQAYQGQEDYGELWNRAKNDEDVNTAREKYLKSANAVNATNIAMTNLPSTINAGSNVVLNASQRNAALGNQMNKYANTLGYWTDQNATDQNMYQTALSTAQNVANNYMAQQQAKVAQTMQDYQTALGQYNELYNQKLSAQSVLQSIYDQMLQDEAQHWREVYDPWAANLSAETERYKQQQANYRAQLDKQLSDYERYLMNKNKTSNTSDSLVVAPYKNLSDVPADTLMNKYGVSLPQATQMKIDAGWEPTTSPVDVLRQRYTGLDKLLTLAGR